MTFLEIATGAYLKAGIISEIESPSAEQGNAAVTRFNDLMAELAEDGIDLGYAPVSSTSDTVTIPAGHVGALKAILGALLYADTMGEPAQGQLLEEANSGRERLQRQAVLLQNTPVRMTHVSPGAGGGRRYNILTDN